MKQREFDQVIANQPYRYRYQSELFEPDWRRLPGYQHVTTKEWKSALWQKRHTVKNVKQLKEVLGGSLSDAMAHDILKDQSERATMSMLVPPQMINTMNEKELKNDPIRRYMIPTFSDRHPTWPSHPKATRDSLHEADMWVVEGLTHRYPTKVLAEIVATCPQYCGHCTRMDLVGPNVPLIQKRRFRLGQVERHAAMLQYLRSTPSIRDVLVSGGDVANVPASLLEQFVEGLLNIEHIRDIRLATKGLISMPQHFLQPAVVQVMNRLASLAIQRGVNLSIHTHINHANSLTPLTVEVSRRLLSMGFHDIRNQGVILAGVNNSFENLLDICFLLLDHAKITPYYFYICDMIPHSEHWRISLRDAQKLQHDIMGYLPGFATPRILCDIPFLGKQWVHHCQSYNQVIGISHWTKNYLTSIENDGPEALQKRYAYYDPIHALPPEGQEYWIQEIEQQLLTCE